MQDLPAEKRNYQAEVYLALATVIQAITLTALGAEAGAALKNLPFPGSIWVLLTGLLSLNLCISFWYIFVRDFFFGFRVVNLTAVNHLVLASVIFLTGLLQYIAFQFLTEPRLWLTLVLLSIAVVLLNTWYASRNLAIIAQAGVQEAFHYDPGYKVFALLFCVALGCLALWYLVPGIDTPLFRGITLLVTGAALVHLNVSAVQVFQKYLEVEL